jgi:phosphoserine aminotransferase
MRPYNFAAGPAMLPEEVLQRISQELFDWRNSGVSVMEIGHRTKLFQGLLEELQQKIKQLMNIPSNYKILFLQGGGQGQFAGIPMNLVLNNPQLDYFITGVWSKKAADSASNYAKVNIVTKTDARAIADKSTWQLNPNACYAYYCPNETINGLAFPEIPDTKGVPLIADMTSNILSYPVDASKFGLIMASAQKNLGIAGVTLVIVRDDLLEQQLAITPSIWNYKSLAACNSSVNTLPVFAVYVMDLIINWVIKQGGVETMAKINRTKANTLYDYIDSSNFYVNNVDQAYRSVVNVPFNLVNPQLIDKFLVEASNNNLKYLEGHATVGGLRASLYNAMPQSGVDALVAFMKSFAKANG